MKTKKATKSKPKHKQGYWDHLLGKEKHREKHREHKPKRKAVRRTAMPDDETQSDETPAPSAPEPQEVETTPLEGASGNEVENPPPAPPKVASEPTEPPEPLAVDETEKGADPEDAGAEWELDIIPESTRGEGPRPEEPEEPEEEAA